MADATKKFNLNDIDESDDSIKFITLDSIECNPKFKILYGRHKSPFGDCLIGVTEQHHAICYLWFIDNNIDYDNCLSELKTTWPKADLIEEFSVTGDVLKKVFEYSNDLCVLLVGTPLQIKIWKILAAIPRGYSVTYSDIAQFIEKPKAVRPVANCCALNRIAIVIPCHRVVAKSGIIKKYRWGIDRRFAILEYENKH